MITIRYFGIIKEKLELNREEIDFYPGMKTNELLALLRNRNSTWYEALGEDQVFRLVINHEMIYEPASIQDGDEIAILPPVTGG